MRGLIRWDLVRRDLRRAATIALLVAVGLVVLVNALNRTEAALGDPISTGNVNVDLDDKRTVARLDPWYLLPHPDRKLDVVVRFTPGRDGAYRVEARSVLTLAADDPAVGPLRTAEDPAGSVDLLLFDTFLLSRGREDRVHTLSAVESHLEQSETGIRFIQTQTGDLDISADRILSVEPPQRTAAQHISIVAADLTVEAVRGGVTTAQDAHSVRVDIDKDDAVPLTVQFEPASPVRTAVFPNDFLAAVLAAIPLVLLGLVSPVTIPPFRRLRTALLLILAGVAWVRSGPPTDGIGETIRYAEIEMSLLLVVLPVAAYLALRASQGIDVLSGRFAAFPGAIAGVSFVLVTAASLGPRRTVSNAVPLLGSVLVITLLTAFLGRVLHPRGLLLGGALGAVFTVGAHSMVLMRWGIHYRGFASIVEALLWIPAALTFAWLVSKRRSWQVLAAAALVPGLVYLPIVVTPSPGLTMTGFPDSEGCTVLIFIATFTFLWRIGGDARVYADPWSRRLAVAVVMLSYGALSASEPTVLAGLAALLLLPASRVDQAVDLGSIDRAKHSQNVAHEIQRRLVRAGESDYLRAAREKLAKGELSTEDLAKGFQPFRAADAAAPAMEQALGSPAGVSPWRNGVAAGFAGVLLAIPTAVLLDPGMPNLQVLKQSLDYTGLTFPFDITVSVFRWAVFAFLYGYFYPRVPGRTAVAKASALALAILVPRLADVLVYRPPVTGGLVVPALVATAQCLLFGLALGLFWELRLARLADVPWTRIRNVRSLKAVAVPAGTVAVAAAVAAATALTNYAMAPITTPPAATSTGSGPAGPAQPAPAGPADQKGVTPPSGGATP